MARPSKLVTPILALLAGGFRHAWSLDDMHLDLEKLGVVANFSSIFRAVGHLVTQGQLHRIGLDNAPPRYELSGSHHDHLRCVRCDVLVAVPCLAPDSFTMGAAGANGFTLHSHNIVLDGICTDCQFPAKDDMP